MLQTVGIIAIAMNIVRSHEALWTKCLFRRNKGLMSSPIIQQTCRLSAKSPIVSTGQGLHFAHHFGLKTVHVTDPMMAELCSFLGGRRENVGWKRWSVHGTLHSCFSAPQINSGLVQRLTVSTCQLCFTVQSRASK